MLPLRLAWAWTIWKAQDQTIRSKIILKLESKERKHSLSYVGFSRATKLSDIGITGGLAGNYLTTSISIQKKLQRRLEEDKRLENLQIGTIQQLNIMDNP